MSTERQMKKIDMDTLQSAEKKVSLSRLRRFAVSAAIVLVLAGGGYATYRMLEGSEVLSRFTVNNMNCPACVITVTEVATKLPGVENATVSLAAQDVTVKFREKKTTPEDIKQAIEKAGYPTRLDGIFSGDGKGLNDAVVATVNGKPIFAHDMNIPLNVDESPVAKHDAASSFFSVIGKEILLKEADSHTVVVQPYEIEAYVQEVFKKQGVSREEFAAWMNKNYGSPEKYYQVVGQRLGIKKLIDDNFAEGSPDAQERNRKTLEWAGDLFKKADVKILDQGFKEKLHAGSGQSDWPVFWPRMIGAQTELKSLLFN
jgi:copper chaperone CopZ